MLGHPSAATTLAAHDGLNAPGNCREPKGRTEGYERRRETDRDRKDKRER